MGVKVSSEVIEVAMLDDTAARASSVAVEVAIDASTWSTPGTLTGASISMLIAEVVVLPTAPTQITEILAEVVYVDADAIPYVVSHPVWID